MRKKTIFVLVLIMILGTIAIGCSPKAVEKEETIETLGKYFDFDVLADVPVMQGEHLNIGKAEEYGEGNYVVDVNGSNVEDYRTYLEALEKAGFTLHSDNGDEGIDNKVYTSTYVKDNLVLTVSHIVNLEKTYLSAMFDLPLSDHLIYNDEFIKDNKKDTKTTLSMMELTQYGNSFVIQLKNGHFIINDGGMKEDWPHLLDYMESLVPKGETPVVEAWIFSHLHKDHISILEALMDQPEQAERLIVEGFYTSIPSSRTFEKLKDAASAIYIQYLKAASSMFLTSTGQNPKIYRMQTGQRYYFSDINIEVLFTQEQLLLGNYNGDFNDSSTWCMYNIEGQKFLLSGDADDGSMRLVVKMYNSDYFDLDVYATFHHNANTRIYFTEFCRIQTVLCTNNKMESGVKSDYYARVEENAHLRNSSVEIYNWGDGTKVLTFPYKVGTVKSLPLINR